MSRLHSWTEINTINFINDSHCWRYFTFSLTSLRSAWDIWRFILYKYKNDTSYQLSFLHLWILIKGRNLLGIKVYNLCTCSKGSKELTRGSCKVHNPNTPRAWSRSESCTYIVCWTHNSDYSNTPAYIFQ